MPGFQGCLSIPGMSSEVTADVSSRGALCWGGQGGVGQTGDPCSPSLLDFSTCVMYSRPHRLRGVKVLRGRGPERPCTWGNRGRRVGSVLHGLHSAPFTKSTVEKTCLRLNDTQLVKKSRPEPNPLSPCSVYFPKRSGDQLECGQ